MLLALDSVPPPRYGLAVANRVATSGHIVWSHDSLKYEFTGVCRPLVEKNAQELCLGKRSSTTNTVALILPTHLTVSRCSAVFHL